MTELATVIWLVLMIGYAVEAVLVSLFVLTNLKRTWDPRRGGLWPHVARVVVVAIAAGIAWPFVLAYVVRLRTKDGERWLKWFVAGPKGQDTT